MGLFDKFMDVMRLNSDDDDDDFYDDDYYDDEEVYNYYIEYSSIAFSRPDSKIFSRASSQRTGCNSNY